MNATTAPMIPRIETTITTTASPLSTFPTVCPYVAPTSPPDHGAEPPGGVSGPGGASGAVSRRHRGGGLPRDSPAHRLIARTCGWQPRPGGTLDGAGLADGSIGWG